jgi:hypothetical protein
MKEKMTIRDTWNKVKRPSKICHKWYGKSADTDKKRSVMEGYTKLETIICPISW